MSGIQHPIPAAPEAAPCAPQAVDDVTPEAMRNAMATFATGVTVITGMGPDGPVGFACQSFASVSLDPPLVLFCADHRGRAWPVIRETKRFAVNVLSEAQMDVCQAFGSRTGKKFDGLDWSESRLGNPMLAGSIAHVDASIETVHLAGDHDVVVGRVIGLSHRLSHRPLVFYRGAFGLEDDPNSGTAPNTWAWDDHWW